MYVLVVSCPHLKGVSKKSGNAYDFYNLNFVEVSKRYGGEVVRSCTTKPLSAPFPSNEDIDKDEAVLPCLAEMTTDSYGNVLSLVPVASVFDMSADAIRTFFDTGDLCVS